MFMRFGLRKLTLLDYPGVIACTVFTCGCNFRCPFCHNPVLVTGKMDDLEYSFAEILEFLEFRGKRLDAVCITGGEPLMHEDSMLLAQAAKALGYRVKLDTNGSYPERLKELVAENAVDFVAMDIKNSPEKYALTSGIKNWEKVRESVDFLKSGQVDYEFRTTVTGNLHERADFVSIGKWLAGAKRYFLQGFKDSGMILAGDAAPFEVTDAALETFLETVRVFVPAAAIRGR